MAELVLNNGKVVTVPYNKAAKIHQILIGDVLPEDEIQQAFCDTVQEVKFDELTTTGQYISSGYIGKKDKVMHNIMADKSLTGYDKFLAVTKRLRERTRSTD